MARIINIQRAAFLRKSGCRSAARLFMGSEETFKAEENIQATLMINRINAPNLNRIRHAFLQNTTGSLAQSIKMYAVKMEVQNIRSEVARIWPNYSGKSDLGEKA